MRMLWVKVLLSAPYSSIAWGELELIPLSGRIVTYYCYQNKLKIFEKSIDKSKKIIYNNIVKDK